MTQVHLNHVVICHVHQDILSELSCQDITKESVKSSDARWRVWQNVYTIPMYMTNNGMIQAYFWVILRRSHAT